MLSISAWAGVQSLLDNYCKIREDDHAIVVYTSDTFEHASWVSAAIAMRAIPVETVWMIALQDAEFSQRFAASLPDPSSVHGRLIVVTFERDTLSHDAAIIEALSKFAAEKTMVYRAISTCDELFTDALKTDPDEISAKNTTLLDLLMPSTSIRVTTLGGSDLKIGISTDKYRWISNRGVWRPKNFVILPAGEVATFPASIEGTLVADFAFNVNMITDMDARLDSHPVTVLIRENRAVNYSCPGEHVSRFLDECFFGSCAYTVGEIGFGTNSSVQKPVHLNSHINERHTGIHLGFGQSNQSPAVVGYDCNIHLDLIARGGRVWIDDKPEPIDLADVSKSPNPHPTHTSDEDARSSRSIEDLAIDDCCGILTSEGIRLFDRPERVGRSVHH
jgi:hypothetical protein